MRTIDKDHALEKIKELKSVGHKDILCFHVEKRGVLPDIYAFDVHDGCVIVQDNFGNIMSKNEMKRLAEYLHYSSENLDEDSLIDDEIDELMAEIVKHDAPKKRTSVKKDKRGYIYIIKGENGRYKIGASKTPEKRCSSLSLASCEKHTLIHFFECEDMYKREKEIHEKYKDKRAHSEWFELSKDDISEIKGLT